MKPLCFILMPFGMKATPAGTTIDFERIYAEIVAPAVSGADLEPLRADAQSVGGMIHKVEGMILCPYAVVDLTLANANVFYESGIRHGVRPWSTVPIIAQDTRLPLDVQMLRTVHYSLSAAGAPDPAQIEPAKTAITQLLVAARAGRKATPAYQLVDGVVAPEVAHEKTDVFRERVEYSNRMKEKLAVARKAGPEALRGIEQELQVSATEMGVVIDLMLSYRAVSAWQDVVNLVDRMSPPLQATVMVREQLGFALNRLGRRDEAQRILTALIEERGPSSETLALLGRVYKDRWQEANNAGDSNLARGYLQKATETYLAGFEADWRDALPGINAVTLMHLQDPPDPRRTEILPLVRYAVQRKMARGKPDYWDYATLLELAVLAGDEKEARRLLPIADSCVREGWEPKTTAGNLAMIRASREPLGAQTAWATEIEKALLKRAGG